MEEKDEKIKRLEEKIQILNQDKAIILYEYAKSMERALRVIEKIIDQK